MARTTRITYDRHRICISPANIDLLGVLKTERYVTVDNAQHGYRLERRQEPLYRQYGDIGEDDTISFPAGLLEPIARLLQEAGRQYDLNPIGNVPRILPTLDPSIRPLFLLDPAAVEPIGDRLQTQIRFDGHQVDPLKIVAQLSYLYPDARMAVVAACEGEVRKVSKRLKKLGIEAPAIRRGYCPETVPKVIVATYSGLAHMQVDVAHLDIVVVLNAAELMSVGNQDAVEAAECARLVGLVDIRRGLSPREEHWVAALYGAYATTVLRHGRQTLPVEFAMLRVHGGQRLAPNLDPLAVKRACVWRHPVRNRRLARLAIGLAERDAERVGEGHPAAVERVLDMDSPRIAMLVENIEHALELARRLPEWPVITGEVYTDGLSSEQRMLLDERRALRDRVQDRMIVTAAGLEHVRVATLDVLIRADAGVGMPAALESLTIPYHRSGRRLLVIDFDDRHHPLLRQWSRQRREAYLRRGWIESIVPDREQTTSSTDELQAAGRGT